MSVYALVQKIIGLHSSRGYAIPTPHYGTLLVVSLLFASSYMLLSTSQIVRTLENIVCHLKLI